MGLLHTLRSMCPMRQSRNPCAICLHSEDDSGAVHWLMFGQISGTTAVPFHRWARRLAVPWVPRHRENWARNGNTAKQRDWSSQMVKGNLCSLWGWCLFSWSYSSTLFSSVTKLTIPPPERGLSKSANVETIAVTHFHAKLVYPNLAQISGKLFRWLESSILWAGSWVTRANLL